MDRETYAGLPFLGRANGLEQINLALFSICFIPIKKHVNHNEDEDSDELTVEHRQQHKKAYFR